MTSPRAPEHGRIWRWAHTPLLHFAILGTLLYLLVPSVSPEADRVIRVDASDLAALEDDWRRRMGRAPSALELERLTSQFIDEALLVRVAQDRGWDRDDPVVRQRLIRNWRFLDPDSEMSDAEALRNAYAVGMDRSDIVVRRRLLERVKLMLAARVRNQPLPDSELATYLVENSADFMQPERLRLTQVYLSRDRRGAALHGDAMALYAEFVRKGMLPEEADKRGDPFLIQPNLPLWSQQQIAERLGGEFAASAAKLSENAWSTPIRSSYGEHMVWLHEREAARLPPLSEIRNRVESALYREREAELLRETVEDLRGEFSIELAQRRDATPIPDSQGIQPR